MYVCMYVTSAFRLGIEPATPRIYCDALPTELRRPLPRAWAQRIVEFLCKNRSRHHEAMHPDMIIVGKKELISRIVVAYDSRVGVKENKIEKYQNLARQLKKLWDTRVKFTP